MANEDLRNAEIHGVIEAFKTILDLSPQDPTALNALADAYQQIGDVDEMIRYQLLLGDAVVEHGDDAAAQHVAAVLAPHAATHAKVREFLARCGYRTPPAGQSPQKQSAAPARHAEPSPRRMSFGFSMADELLFGWRLMQAKLLSGDDYSVLLKDMTAYAARGETGTISVLHTLHACSFGNLEGVIAYVVQQTGTPFISLANIVLQYASLSLMPLDSMRRQGVLPFGLVGKDALVCIMNPFNAKLRSRLVEELGRPCHFYVSMPSEFDDAILRASDIIREHSGVAV